MPLAAALLLLTALQEPKLVTYRSAGASAAAVAAELGRLTGVPLTTSPHTASEVIVVRMVDVPLPQALNQISAAVNGTWKAEGEGFRLVRTSEQSGDERTSELIRLSRGYEAALARLRKGAAKVATLTPAQIEQQVLRYKAVVEKDAKVDSATGSDEAFAVQRMMPAAQLQGELLRSFTGLELAQLADGARLTFATSPVGAQRPFDKGRRTAIARFFSQQTLWRQAAARHAVELPRSSSYIDLGVGEPSAPMPIAERVVFRLKSASDTMSVEFNLRVLDGKGRQIADWTASVDPQLPAGSLPSDVTPKTVVDAPPFLLALSDGINGNPKLKPFRTRLRRPDQAEPLSLGIGETLVRIAELRKRNLVACLADVPLASFVAGSGKLHVLGFLKELIATHTLEEVAGWSVLKPTWPVKSRARRAHRLGMAAFLTRMATGVPLTFEEQASIAAQLPSPDANRLPWELASALRDTPVETHDDWHLLRWIGGLTTAQRQATNRDGLRLADLGPAQLGALQKLLYGDNVTLVEISEDGGTSESSGSMDLEDKLPEGFSVRGFATMRGRSEQMIRTSPVQSTTGRTAARALTVGEYVDALVRPSVPDEPSPLPTASLEKVQLGARTVHQIRIHLTPTMFAKWDVPDVPRFGPTWLTEAELPEPIRRRIERFRRLQKRSPSISGSVGRSADERG